MDTFLEEIPSLHRYTRDLGAFTTLLASWIDQEPHGLVESLVDTLLCSLDLDLVYACIKGIPEEGMLEAARAAGQSDVAAQAPAIGRALAPWLKDADFGPPPSIPNLVGSSTVQLAVIPIGVEGAYGIVVAGAQRPDFPTEVDRLLLSLSANQAATCLHLLAREHTARIEWQRAASEAARWRNLYEESIQTTGELLYERNAQMQLAAIVESSGDAILSLTLDGIILSWNTGAEHLYGHTAAEIIGQSISLLAPPEQQETLQHALEQLRQGERIEYAETVQQQKDGSRVEVSLTISPVKNASGQIIGISMIARDITARKQAEEALREQARLAAFSAEVGFALTQATTLQDILQRCTDAMVHHLEAACARIWTLKQNEHMLQLQASAGLSTDSGGIYSRVPVGQFSAGLIAQEQRPYFTNAVIGDPYIYDQEWAKQEGIVAFVGHPLMIEDRVIGVMAMFARSPLTEATVQEIAAVANAVALGVERKRVEMQLQEEIRIVETLHRVGTTLIAELELDKLLQTITDEATAFTGAQFGAFFYNVVNAQGEAYQLYTISGAPREAFAPFPMPRNTTLFGPTFRGEGVICLADVTRDARYGQNPPYYGMPPGHLPVRSYLAAPVVSRSGEVLGGLFFGHPEPGVFDARDERIITGIAAQAAVALDNARLYQQAQEAKQTLLHQATELQRSNAELQEFAYVASHDLQEPLRMVISYVQLLAQRTQNTLDAETTEFINFAVEGAKRMKMLIDALLTYSRAGANTRKVDLVDCEALFASTLKTLSIAITESSATITHDSLPTVRGDAMQIGQVLQNLLSNALKFHSQEPPRVHVTARQEGQHWVFAIRDNGIGIASEHGERIFQVFQRLHTRQEYPGTGIGLAICKKIVEQHGGRIWVESTPGQGATFFFTLQAL